MIVGIGVDLVETARIKESIDQYGDRFIRRLYTSGEIDYCEKFKNRAERFAARFAAKEAGFKALGTGWREGVRWLDVEVSNQANGKPELLLHGRAEEIARALGVSRRLVSISHADGYAIVQVVFESDASS